MDPYASCLCGSGKKFKWCCQPIYPIIQRAMEQYAAGQHSAAFGMIEQLVKDHAGNPEAWGQYARLLYSEGKVDEAEEALEKAFALNPTYPFGLLLRAHLSATPRANSRGADPGPEGSRRLRSGSARAVAQIYSIIFDCEMRRNNPVAGRAALEQMVRLQPGNEELRGSFEKIFGPDTRLPLAARKMYEFRKPAGNRREAWNRAMGGTVPR